MPLFVNMNMKSKQLATLTEVITSDSNNLESLEEEESRLNKNVDIY